MRKSLASNNCHIARAANQIGDGWILLILWATSNGINRFDDLQRELGVARNILSDRLRRMVKYDLLEKTPVQEGARRLEYKPTQKTTDLQNVLSAISEWSTKWCPIETTDENIDNTSSVDSKDAPKKAAQQRRMSA
jgi:DNA-binding HxlR family transcriptional regulator